MSNLRLILSASLLAFSLPVLAATELNLTRDGASDPSSTALIVTGKGSGSIFLGGAVASLQFITDLSTPDDQRKAVKISAFFHDKYPRVTPGAYLVQVGCWEGGGGLTINQTFGTTIDAKPGKIYVVSCEGHRAVSRSVHVEETEQSQPGK